MEWTRILAYITGSVDQELLLRNEYLATLIWDGCFSLVVAPLAGFGRAAAEVGAIMIVGGNINGYTRTMTTAIALETSKGDLSLAIGLGMVLIAIVITVNALAWLARWAGGKIA